MEQSVEKRFVITGMTCAHCQERIESALRGEAGVIKAAADFRTGEGAVTYDPARTDFEKLRDTVAALGYEIPEEDPARQAAVRTASLTVIILALYVILQRLGLLTLLVPSRLAESGMGYGALFVTGLLTSFHCVAMCGGIHLSQCLPGEEGPGLGAFGPPVLYNLGRVISYTVIGGLLGGVGSLLGRGGAGVPVLLQGGLKLIAGVLMVLMGVNMLGLYPGLRRLSLRLPPLRRRGLTGPFGVGLLNGLMPCGPLQSMQILALASGSPVTGAVSMLMFSLGTVPLMLGLGAAVSALGQRFTRAVTGVGAVLVVVLGLAMLSQGGSLSGMISPTRLLFGIAALGALGVAASLPLSRRRRLIAAAVCLGLIAGAGFGLRRIEGGSADREAGRAMEQNGEQVVYSTLESGGYPSIRVKAGVPVRWIIQAPAGSVNGCNYKMILSEYGVEHEFTEGENLIEFLPVEKGTVAYTCWMGMLQGTIYVE